MTLTPNNFPSELYGRGGKGRSKQVLSNVMNVNKASDGTVAELLCAHVEAIRKPALACLQRRCGWGISKDLSLPEGPDSQHDS